MDDKRKDSWIGSVANFVISSGTAIQEISGSDSNTFRVYRCGRCNQPLGKLQQKCYHCGAIQNWKDFNEKI